MNGIILYSIVFFFLVSATGLFLRCSPSFAPRHSHRPALYLTRHRWLDYLPDPIYSRIPSSFAGDAELGLTSDAFDLAGNIADGDARAGLDATAKRQIRRIMKRRRVDFDEARQIYTEERFARNDIGPDGRPRDPKFVSFS